MLGIRTSEKFSYLPRIVMSGPSWRWDVILNPSMVPLILARPLTSWVILEKSLTSCLSFLYCKRGIKFVLIV